MNSTPLALAEMPRPSAEIQRLTPSIFIYIAAVCRMYVTPIVFLTAQSARTSSRKPPSSESGARLAARLVDEERRRARLAGMGAWSPLPQAITRPVRLGPSGAGGPRVLLLSGPTGLRRSAPSGEPDVGAGRSPGGRSGSTPSPATARGCRARRAASAACAARSPPIGAPRAGRPRVPLGASRVTILRSRRCRSRCRGPA